MSGVVSREAVFAAVFAAVQQAPGFVTQSRTLKDWGEVPAQQQPALFQAEGKQSATARRGVPNTWMLRGELWVYCHEGNMPVGVTDVVTLLNNQIDALVNVIEGPRELMGFNPLGGLVGDVRVQGDIETSEGRLGQQAVAVIPFESQPLT